MYRNIHYYVDRSTQLGMIKLWTWDDNGIPAVVDLPHESSLYYEDPTGSYKSIYNTNLVKKTFPNVYQRSKFVRENPQYKFFDIKQPAVEFLHDAYHTVSNDPSFAKNELYLHFIDIEIAVEDEFPNAMQAKYPINLITIYDNKDERFITWALPSKTSINIDQIRNDIEYKKKCPINWDQVELRVFDKETDLLHDYMNWHCSNYPDGLVGWNTASFDIPYIINRVRAKLGERVVNRYSPVGILKAKEFENKFGTEVEYKIAGITSFDYMLLYRDKFNYKKKPSYRLDAICQAELGDGIGKLEFDESFKSFYQNRFQDYTEYNIRDVELLVMLDKKLRYIELTRSCCNRGLVDYDMVYKAMPYVYNSVIVEEMRGANRKFPAPPENTESTTGFTGAYVMDPYKGRYDYLASMDLNSLYPNIIITLNISPETKFGKVVERGTDSVTIRLASGKLQVLTLSQFEKLLEKHCTISSHDVLYYKPEVKQGAIPKFLVDLYAERKLVQKEMRRANDRIYEIEQLIDAGKGTPELLRELKDEQLISSRCFTQQLTIKIVLNTTYGILGNPYCPIFDIDNAESTTKSGQTILKKSKQFVDIYMQKRYNVKDYSVVYGDTDSMYICIDSMVKSFTDKTHNLTDDEVQKACSLFDQLVAATNKFAFRHIVKEVFRSTLDRITFEREVFAEGGVLLAKKRYILRLRNDDGVMCDKLKIMGHQVKRNEIAVEVKNAMIDFIERCLRERWDNTKAQEAMHNIYDNFCKLLPSSIAFNKGLTTPKAAIGFLRCEKGAGMHARAAIYYNQLIKHLGISDKYTQINPGDKVRYYHVKTNKYDRDIIGFGDKYPSEFDDIFQINYSKMFEKMVVKSLESIFECHGWRQFDPDYDNSLFDF